MALLYDPLYQNKLNGWRKIKSLSTPLGIKNIEFNEEDSKESYLAKGFQEVEVGVAPKSTRYLKNSKQNLNNTT